MAARPGRRRRCRSRCCRKAFTRFRVPWRWDGGPAMLQSRAWDEAGNVQPTRAEFVAARGELKAVPPVGGVSEPALQRDHQLGDRQRQGEVKHVYA